MKRGTYSVLNIVVGNGQIYQHPSHPCMHPNKKIRYLMWPFTTAYLLGLIYGKKVQPDLSIYLKIVELTVMENDCFTTLNKR